MSHKRNGNNMIEFSKASSGIDGLDTALRGGYVTGRMYLVYGSPGAGKTIAGLHFLEEGLTNDESVLCIHGEESQSEIIASAAALNIDISDAAFLDLGPDSEFFAERQSYDLVDPGEIEGENVTKAIHTAVEEVAPDRVVVDPVTQLRYIATSELQFRQEMISFIRFLKDTDITVVSTATPAPTRQYETELRSLSDGIIQLTRGEDGRRLEVVKHRNVGQIDGEHGMAIRDAGIEVFPSLIPERHEQSIGDTQVSSGLEKLDTLLGGGVEENTVTFISGPTGAGKTTLGTQLSSQAIDDSTAIVYLFEESINSFTQRSEALGIPVTDLREKGLLTVRAVEPLAHSAEEFAVIVRKDIDQQEADITMVDGIDGYTMAIQGDKQQLLRKLHSLSRYLTNAGVTVIVTDEITEVTGVSSATSIDASYIADNIIVLSYIEMEGTLRKTIGVLKKRVGTFEHTLREFTLTEDGIVVGDQLTNVSGILQGTPSASSTK
jgi:circadian clock protein KaiC